MVRLPERIPRNIALELLLTGEPLRAERAERFGLVNYLTEPGGALKRAAGIAHNAPLAVEAVKLVVNERRAFCDQDAFAEQDRIVAPVLASHDAQEGAHAFAERRSPPWQGR
ncbi:enoyl-CoA hydratase-related protein [Streptomyces sp. NPDC002758]